MPDLSAQQIAALQEWVDSLPGPRRWAVKAGLIAGGYMSWTGKFKSELSALTCLVILLIIFFILLFLVGKYLLK